MLSEALRARADALWQSALPSLGPLGPLGPKLDAEIRAIPGERGILLSLAYGTLPISDAASVPVAILDGYGSHALFLRKRSPFCRDIPEEMFLHFVWYPRINSEALTDCRAFFYERLAPRVDGLDGESAILEVNRWCAEHMTYQLTDGRTESPMAAYRCGAGRCGEESVFLTTALRSVGIPARQVYAPWWAHCDDNHAWVEAWDGKRWRFLGACEPEPVLDRGWFCDAAARAPLVHYRTFFDCNAGDPLAERMGSVRLYSVTERYADVFRLTVRVVDEDGAPADGAAVELNVMNMAAFRPILRNRTDANGRFEATLGRADLHVEAFRDDCVAMADVHPASDAAELRLRLAPPAPRSFDSDLTPPPPSGRNRIALTPEQKERNAAGVAACAARRAERAKGWARPEYEAAEEPWPKFFALAAGNAPELWKFYAAHEGAERALAARMLEAMAEKDCRDARFEILEGHFQAALPFTGAEHFVDAVLNPRIGPKELEDWRSAIRAAFSPEQLAEFAKRPEALFMEAVLNPRIGPKELEEWRPAIRAAFSPERLAEFAKRPEALFVEAVLNPRIGPKELENWRSAIRAAFSPEQLAEFAKHPEVLFAEAVLNPRIGLEELEDWRPAIRAAFSPERLAEFAARPEALFAEAVLNPRIGLEELEDWWPAIRAAFSPERLAEFVKRPEALFAEAVLNPRIGLEELEDWRSAIRAAFSPERLAVFAKRPEALFAEAVLNPRIGLEELEDWRSAIRAAFSPERLAEFAARPEALMEHLRAAYSDLEGNHYPTLSMTPSAMLSTGRADEKGRQTLFVAILRTLGIPARLNPADGGAKYWRDGAWHPAEAEQAATCQLRLVAQPGERFAYEANWSLARLEGDRWQTLELRGAPNPFALALRPGFYRLTTANRLPNGCQLCRATEFALEAGQSATLPLELRSAPPERMLSRIPLDEIWLRGEGGEAIRAQALPGEFALLAWLEPGAEPTEHILNELLDAAEATRSQMERGVALAFVLRDRAALENATLQRALAALPRARVLFDDPASPAAEDLARRLFLEPDNLPLAVLLDRDRAARFASAGYQVGLVDLTLKLIDCMK